MGRFNWEYVFQGNPDYPEHIGTMDNGPELTTEEAQRHFRIIDGELIPK